MLLRITVTQQPCQDGMPMSLRDDLDLWGKAAVCSDAFASELDLCLHIGSYHGVDGRGTITHNSPCTVEPYAEMINRN